MTTRNWLDWHGAYDRPGSRLAERLAEVQAQIAGALDRAPAGPVRVVSMCAGFEEVAFVTGDDRSWGVGANRLVGEPAPYEAGVRLFTFVDELPP